MTPSRPTAAAATCLWPRKKECFCYILQRKRKNIVTNRQKMFSITNVNQQKRPVFTAACLCCVALVYAASFSSGIFNEYVYTYEVNVLSGASGFTFKARATLEILYAVKGTNLDDALSPSSLSSSSSSISNQYSADSVLVRLRLSEPVFFNGPSSLSIGETPQQMKIDHKYNKLYNPEHDLYAHIVTLPNGTALVKELFTHQSDATTFKNIKKSILLNILPTNHHLNVQSSSSSSPSSSTAASNNNNQEFIAAKPFWIHDNNLEQPELFSPDSISHVDIIAKARKSIPESTTTSGSLSGINTPTVFQSVEGHQNVTFGSRVFAQAESKLVTNFHLELIDQIKSSGHERFDSADSMQSALKLLDRKVYQQDTVQLERERRICSTHHCSKTLGQLFDDYREFLRDEMIASVEAAVAFLRILDRLRSSEGTSVADIGDILKRTRGNQGIESSFLDILAAARTRDSVVAALKHLRLTKSRNLDVAERFLSVLSVAVKTTAKMRRNRPLKSPYYFDSTPPLKLSSLAKQQQARLASLEFIAKEFLKLFEQIPAKKWASTKLRWSSLMTLATLVNANNQEHQFENVDDELNRKVNRLLLSELKSCEDIDSDCRIVIMQAIGNVGHLSEIQFQVLKDQVLEFGRRESNTAMKVIRDLLQNQAKDKPLGADFYASLKDFLLRIVYDNTQETTSRVLASEMIVRFVPNSLASDELLNHLPSFGNNELATMICSRMQSLRADDSTMARHHENWYWRSSIINGTSKSFIKTMARTESLNASYGVNVEFMNKAEMIKELSFDLFLDTKKRTQDLFSLDIFARGLSVYANGDGAEMDDDETMMAGMSLRILGGYLRPYVFFTGKAELTSHIFFGTASEPMSAYNGDLLLIDHDEGYPLISGFVAEQQLRGVLSIDVSGKIKVSLWNQNSHSVVTNQASIIAQASQSVYTSYDNLWHSHLFSFGGQALIDVVTDVHLTPKPVRFCLQVTQPEFNIRHNSRRHEQMMTSEVRRKITKRHYSVGAKSYSLSSEINKMCSALADEL